MAVAGKPNRVGNAALPQGRPPALVLNCWPMQRTDQVPFTQPFGDFYNDEYPIGGLEEDKMMLRMEAMPMMAPPPPPPSPTAAIQAQQEDLGDLKLFRIPERMTVNAKGQKQVAMLVQPKAKFRRIYRAEPIIYGGYQGLLSLTPMLIGKNEKLDGLGLPLPSGTGMVFENSAFGSQLIGEIMVKDRAIGDDIELTLPPSIAVMIATTRISQDKNSSVYTMRLSNANPYAISAEIRLPDTVRNLPAGVRKKDGRPTWFVTVPGNADSELTVNVPFR